MEANGAREALDLLIGTDVSVADHGELAAVSRSVARLQSLVDLAKVQISRRTRALAAAGDTTSAHALIDDARLTGKEAKATDDRERVCGTLPQFEHALADGRCTAGHLDALAGHTKDLTDAERADLADVIDELLANAESQPISLFDRTTKGIIDQIRDTHRPDTAAEELDRQRKASKVKRWTERDTGMRNTLISLDPIRDASLWNVIDHHLRALRSQPHNAERAFSELQIAAVLAAVNPAPGAARVPEIVVHADAGSICHGRHADTLCETADGVPIPVETIQRLCCEAVIQAVVVNPDGTIDRLCEELRMANRKQRRLLEAMYSTCAHPHCSVPFTACRVHHIVWFTRGGKTVLANLLPLCETHHHLVHEGGWNLTIDDRRRVTWYRPDGTTWLADDGPNRRTARPQSAPPGRPRPRPRPPATATPATARPPTRPTIRPPARTSSRSDDPPASILQTTLC